MEQAQPKFSLAQYRIVILLFTYPISLPMRHPVAYTGESKYSKGAEQLALIYIKILKA